ncbi:hypothetical protein B0H14DRAFT_2901759, partial [Mycena olivaceomarginata]
CALSSSILGVTVDPLLSLLKTYTTVDSGGPVNGNSILLPPPTRSSSISLPATQTSSLPSSGHIPASSGGSAWLAPSSRWCSPFCYGGVASDAAGTRGWRTTPTSKIAPWTRLPPPSQPTNLIPQPFLAVLASVAPFADRNAIAREKRPCGPAVGAAGFTTTSSSTETRGGRDTRICYTTNRCTCTCTAAADTDTTQRERDLEEEVQRLREQLADGSPPAYSAKPDAILPE